MIGINNGANSTVYTQNIILKNLTIDASNSYVGGIAGFNNNNMINLVKIEGENSFNGNTGVCK